jgi:hypothetical protein
MPQRRAQVPAVERLRFCCCLPRQQITLTRESLLSTLPHVQLSVKYLVALDAERLIGRPGSSPWAARSFA